MSEKPDEIELEQPYGITTPTTLRWTPLREMLEASRIPGGRLAIFREGKHVGYLNSDDGEEAWFSWE